MWRNIKAKNVLSTKCTYILFKTNHLREHKNNKHECETPENKTIQMFILNVIIVTYFSQRRMLYGDTTLPSTLHWETSGRVPQHSFIWWRTGQAWPGPRQNCLVVERAENACTGICLQGHSNPHLIWICANVFANTTLHLLHSVAQNCLCLKTKDNQNHFLFRCVSISRTRGVSQSVTQSVTKMVKNWISVSLREHW